MFISRNTSAKGGRRARTGAFTLVELTLALLVLMLLVGVLYAIVEATLRSAAELEDRQNRNQELSGFLSVCRKTFHTMPSSAQFEARVIPLDEKYSSELIFRNAPGLFWWGDAKNASISTILGVRNEVGGLVGMGILQDSEDQISSYIHGGTASRPWLMLLPDLRAAEWRFYDPGSALWLKEWKNTSVRPAYAELTLTTSEGTAKYTFWLPPLVNAGIR